jgi:hypothetical protein
MYLTLDTIQKLDIDDRSRAWLKTHFPNGAEIIDIFNHQFISPDFLHWIYVNFTTTDKEKEAYRKKLKINCGDANYSIYCSNDVAGCSYVTHSSHIDGCERVFYSNDVRDSNNILHSNNVENSKLVYGSDFVYDSERVINGKNVNASTAIVNSEYVVHSRCIFGATNIKNSAYISDIGFAETKQISDSYFISGSKNLNHCLFCFGIENQSYQLFNKPIDEMEYTMIVRQMQSILRDWEPELVKDNYWPQRTIPLDSPILQRNAITQWKNLPDRFWDWVKTLPNYREDIMYSLTYQGDKI